MGNIFKNPWTWLGVLLVLLLVGEGWFLFFRKSAPEVFERTEHASTDISQLTTENRESGVEGEERQKKLSEEISDEIVRKLEEGSGVPEEGNEQGTGSKEQETGDNEQEIESNEQGTRSNEQETVVSVVNRLASWGFTKGNGRKIDTVVLHSTYNALGGDPFSVEKIIDIYKSYEVAPHYLVARDGTVYRLVEERNIAYHAGTSKMPDGRTDVNDFSIGIEIIGKDDGSPSDPQYVSLKKLLADIKSRHAIKYVVGHSDIAHGRKTDPWGLEWERIQ